VPVGLAGQIGRLLRHAPNLCAGKPRPAPRREGRKCNCGVVAQRRCAIAEQIEFWHMLTQRRPACSGTITAVAGLDSRVQLQTPKLTALTRRLGGLSYVFINSLTSSQMATNTRSCSCSGRLLIGLLGSQADAAWYSPILVSL
jgi:hypothetical protein